MATDCEHRFRWDNLLGVEVYLKCRAMAPSDTQRIKRGEDAEKLLERVWLMIQRNQLTHYTDERTGEDYDKKCQDDRAEFGKFYNDVHDFDPGCIDWWES